MPFRRCSVRFLLRIARNYLQKLYRQTLIMQHRYNHLASFFTDIHSNTTRNKQLKVLLHSRQLGHSRTPRYCRGMSVNVHKWYLSIIELEMVHNQYWLIVGSTMHYIYLYQDGKGSNSNWWSSTLYYFQPETNIPVPNDYTTQKIANTNLLPLYIIPCSLYQVRFHIYVYIYIYPFSIG